MSAHSGLRRPLLAGVLACLALPTVAADPPITFVTLGTSESLYYDVGRALCSVVDKTRREHGIRCSPEQTPGSVYNLERLADRDLDLALAQSDAQFAAFQGEKGWEGRPIHRAAIGDVACAWHDAQAAVPGEAWDTMVRRYRTEGRRQQGKGISGNRGV